MQVVGHLNSSPTPIGLQNMESPNNQDSSTQEIDPNVDCF